MTTQIYLEDAYCFEHDATVVSVSGNDIVLDRTCMYPGGGGQPPDRGEIALHSGLIPGVQTVSKGEGGVILHQCSGEVPPDVVGMDCHVKVDGVRRVALMRYHTALHVFNTVMLRTFDGWITGVSIGADGSHIDFKVDNYTEEMPKRIEQGVNLVLARNLPVKAYYVTEEEFHNRPDLLRTLEAKPPVENGRVRVVEIEGFEAQACGGTHVRNTAEVGTLSVVKVRSKGRNNRRFHVLLASPKPL
jgi:misacylated tRNA(Ala) deacylase